MKQNYFIPDSFGGAEAFAAQWKPIEAGLKKILPLRDAEGNVVGRHTSISDVDFSGVVAVLAGAPADMAERFLEAVGKKDPGMTVEELLARDSAEVTRWRKMGNKFALLPNALVLHLNMLDKA